jgi:hypothetical protein
MWRVLRLNRAEAATLRNDMTALLNRYQATAGANGGDVFLVHAAIARRRDQSGSVDNEITPASRS